MIPKSSATIADVARKAGVSTATVSRLINGIGPVSDDTQERVRDAIDELNYSPKRKRRKRGDASLPGRAPDGSPLPPLAFLRVGAFENQDRSPVTEQLADALHRSAHAHGRTLSVHHIPEIDLSTNIREIVGDAQGVLLRTSNIRDVTQQSVKWLNGLPAVQVLGEDRTGRLWVDHVTPDNGQAGALAAEYLIEQGCPRLVFAAAGWFCGVGVERCMSFLKTASDAGVDAKVIVQSFAEGKEKLEKKLSGLGASFLVTESRMELIQGIAAEKSEPFGLFIPTDLELAMVMPQLQMLGVEFGKDFHIIGCDRETRCLSGLDPLPATMDLHVSNIATRAIRRLIYRIEHPNEPLVRISVAPDIVRPHEVMDVGVTGGVPQQLNMVSATS